MKTHTHTATVREMRTLANTCKTHATDAAESWKNCHTLAATAHSAANRATVSAIDAEKAAHSARAVQYGAIITLIITIIISTVINLAIISFS